VGGSPGPADRSSPEAGGWAPAIRATSDGAVLWVHLQPGAREEGLCGWHGDALKVKVRAPAVSGRANEALLAVLAVALGVPAGTLSIVSGATSRAKRVGFAGVGVPELGARLESALEQG
jgi:uncharacterized protein (TIGR00251 family)